MSTLNLIQNALYAIVTKKAKFNENPITYFPQSQSTNLITVYYKDLSRTFNNELLYKTFDEEDKIYMILYNLYDENNNIIKEELLLP